ncbi:MAG: hypothetical protein Q9184_003684 [Pyrenodesmia sp. 2 TL-2023]
MNATKLSRGAAVVEHDNKSQSSSSVVQHESLSDTPIGLIGSAGPMTLPKPASLSFEVDTKQLGSHMAHIAEEGECLTMFMELENLSGAPTPVVDRHHILKRSSVDLEEIRLRKICGVIADVDRLFSDTGDGHHREAAEFVLYEKESLSSLEHQNHPEGLLYDVEKQTLAEELPRNDNGCSDTAYYNTSRIACLTILLAALVWRSVSLLS